MVSDEAVKASRQKLAAVLLAILEANESKVQRGLISALKEIRSQKANTEEHISSAPLSGESTAPDTDQNKDHEKDVIPEMSNDKNETSKPTGLAAKENLIYLTTGSNDKSLLTALTECGIKTISDLRHMCRTISGRDVVIQRYMSQIDQKQTPGHRNAAQKSAEQNLTRMVSEADLWRVQDMDSSTASMLLQLGVRHCIDLSKLDADIVHPLLVSLSAFSNRTGCISADNLKKLIDNAASPYPAFDAYQDKLQSRLAEALNDIKSKFRGGKAPAALQSLLNTLSEDFSSIQVEDIIGDFGVIEMTQEPPVHLFRSNPNPEMNAAAQIPTVVNISKIKSGIEALKNMPMELHPPRFVHGRVLMVKPGQDLPETGKDRRGYALYDALVELDGTATANTDSTENAEKPSAYTDGDGCFTIELPNGTNLCQKLTLTVSRGSNKQKFSISADTLLDNCPERQIINKMLLLDKLYEDYLHDDELYQSLKTVQDRIVNGEDVNEKDRAFYESYQADMESLYKEIQLAEERIQVLEEEILETDKTTKDMSRILRNLTEKTDIEADLSENPFIVNESIFKGLRTDQPKVMPSVKLMEQDDKPVYLPTDTAPSKIYQYSMLQRLVEPEIRQGNSAAKRESIEDALDIATFRKNLASNHNDLKYMSSLGIGYNLNMHQAWVPDGFALGTLLYSLVLAPGEEQRLVVRENKQSYTIIDEASGTDGVSESYDLSQQDNTDAAFNYAMNQMMSGNSNYQSSASGWAIGASASYGGGGAGIGLSGGYSSSKSKGSASASQRNSHSEASSAAQTFQHGIKMASEKISQAQRLSVSLATSEQEDSVATRIIANHNHSHAMTVQYWEVMRRYRLETCVDSVDLVLFVPMKPICFAPPKNSDLANITPASFKSRYQAIMDNADVLETALPYKYRAGLNVIEKYSTMSNWQMEASPTATNTVTMNFTGTFLNCDNLTATLVLKNGKGSVQGRMDLEKHKLVSTISTSNDVYEAIRETRNGKTEYISGSVDKEHTCTFDLPHNATHADIAYIRLNYSCEPMYYELYKTGYERAEDGSMASEIHEKMMDQMWKLAKDTDDSANDRSKIAYYKQILPEAWISPNRTISASKIKSLGNITIDVTGVTFNKIAMGATLNSTILKSSNTVSLSLTYDFLTNANLQKAEQTLQHVMNNTMRYSQAVWRSLSQSERAMLLDQYTIHMNWDDIAAEDADTTTPDIPLLNCINVHKMLGFYGNCMLFPFTYPEELANQIGRTAAELQDTLLRHHTNNFRVPVTTISLPTNGMVGEAVLGATNVSEEIDLTRFWNWQDSPIDTMDITKDFLNGTDYLNGKDTMALTGLNLSGVSQPNGTSSPDLISALIAKQLPEFDNITGQQYLKDLITSTTNSADAARTAALSNSSEAMKKAMDHAEKLQSMENELTKAYLAKNRNKDGNLFTDASSDGSNKPGGSGDGTGGGNSPGGSGDGTGGKNPGGSGDGNKPGGSGGQGGSSGGKTADILINYYNGSSGVTTVQQKPSGGEISQEDLDKLVQLGQETTKQINNQNSTKGEG